MVTETRYASYSFDVETDKTLRAGVGETGGDVGENEIKDKILTAMLDDPKISARALAQRMDVTTRTVERNIRALKAAGIVERIGGARGGRWEVKTTIPKQ